MSGEVYTELYRAVHRALSAIRNNRVSAFQGEVYTGRIGSIVGTFVLISYFHAFATRPTVRVAFLEDKIAFPEDEVSSRDIRVSSMDGGATSKEDGVTLVDHRVGSLDDRVIQPMLAYAIIRELVRR